MKVGQVSIYDAIFYPHFLQEKRLYVLGAVD